MESAKQERKNLMNDMPIVNRASGSWMSKHSRAAVSPVEMGGSGKMNPIEMGHKESPMAIDTDPKSGRDKRFTYDSAGRPDGFLGSDGGRTIPDNINLKAAQEGTGSFDPKSGGNVPFKGGIRTSDGSLISESQFRDPSNKNMAMGVVDHSGKFTRFNSPKSKTDNLSKSQVFKDYSNVRDEYKQRRQKTLDLQQKYKDYNKAGGQFKQINKKDPKSGR
jgi:hypothetical protein